MIDSIGTDPFVRENLFVRDPSLHVGTLGKDVKLARIDFNDWAPSLLSPSLPEDLNSQTLHVAFCFDSAGLLRVRPIVALLPSVDLTKNLVVDRTIHLYGLGQAWVSQVGGVGIRQSLLEGALGSLPVLSAVQVWLKTPGIGATLVVNRWTGRPLPGPEAG